MKVGIELLGQEFMEVSHGRFKMILSWKYIKEAERKAEKDNGYFTSEMVIGYLMTHHPVPLILDMLLMVILIFLFMLAVTPEARVDFLEFFK